MNLNPMKTLRSNKGTAVIFFAISFFLIAGCSALVVDVGATVIEKGKISNACDAAVLAGAMELQNNPGNAENVAKNYLQKNGVDINEAAITIAADKRSISITINRTVNYTFAKFLGYSSGNVTAHSQAGIEALTGVTEGVRPFAIEDQTLIYGQNYILKDGAGNGSNGNYDLLALGGRGASVVSYNIVYGYSGALNVGDSISTQPGNMSGPTTSSVESLLMQDTTSTYDNYRIDSPRIITVIVVDTINVDGSKPVTIRGFAAFFLEDVIYEGGHTEVVGKFIKTVTTGVTSPSQNNYGLVGIKLLN